MVLYQAMQINWTTQQLLAQGLVNCVTPGAASSFLGKKPAKQISRHNSLGYYTRLDSADSYTAASFLEGKSPKDGDIAMLLGFQDYYVC